MRSPSLMKPLFLYSAPAAERPREPRVTSGIIGTISMSGDRVPVRLTDLSHNGFGACSAVPVPIGSDIVVRLPVVGDVRAQVRWALGGLFGARFLDQIDVEALVGGFLETLPDPDSALPPPSLAPGATAGL